jgi:hypothetical protein
LDGRFHEKEIAMTRQASQLVREGQYAAEVAIELLEDGGDWGPTIAPDDIRKLDRVRVALRQGNLAEAEKDARLFRLVPYEGDEISVAGFGENEQDGYKP